MHRFISHRLLAAVFLLLPAMAGAAPDPGDLAAQVAALRDEVPLAPRQSWRQLTAILDQLPATVTPLRIDTLVELSNADFWRGDKAGALRRGKEIEVLGKRSNSQAIVARALLAQAYPLSENYDEPAAQALVRRARALAEQTDDVPLKVQARISLGEITVDDGHAAAGMALIDAALDLARASGNTRLVFMALRSRAMRGADRGVALALADVDELLALAQATPGPARTARARLTEYAVAARGGNADRALNALTQAISLLRQLAAEEQLATAYLNLSDLYLYRKRYAQALDASREAARLAHGAGNADTANVAAFNSGVANLYLGHRAEGERQVGAVIKLAADNLRPQNFTQYADALAAIGDHDKALQYYRYANDVDSSGQVSNKQMSVKALKQALQNEQQQKDVVSLQNDSLQKAIQLGREQQYRWKWWAATAFFALSLAMLTSFLLRIRRDNRILSQQKLALTDVNAALEWQSDHDWLTKLFNRRHFHKYMAARATMPAGAGTIFILDIDHFKKINDTHGHSGGDSVLVEVARRLASVLRSGDVLVRWGGEEFLLYVPGAGNDEAAQFAARLLDVIATPPIWTGSTQVDVTISAGYCPTPVVVDGAVMDWESAANVADAALYSAKQGGRNRACGVDGPVSVSHARLALLQTAFGAAAPDGAVRIRHIHNSQPRAGANDPA